MPSEPRDDPSALRCRPSVLDRLAGLSASGRYEAPWRGRPGDRMSRVVRMLRSAVGPAVPLEDVAPLEWAIAAVKEDLRCLLNTTRPRDEVRDDDPLARSVSAFGLPDLSGFTAAELLSGSGDLLRRAVEEAVARFEPRLQGVRVTVRPDTAPAPRGDPGRTYDRVTALHLHVSADLVLLEGARPVAFDTVMNLGTGEIQFDRGGDAAGP